MNMAEPATEKRLSDDETKKDPLSDPEIFSCVLQPFSPANSDPNYVGIRRFLLYRKAQSGVTRRKDWKFNGKGYVAYRNYINRPRNWENMHLPSRSSTPNQSGRWLSSPGPLSFSYELDSWSSNRGLQSDSQVLSHSPSSGSIASEIDHPRRRVELAYSFVGMHCIFDQCRAMVTILKFGHMSSDLLAFGASDGTLTVCTVSDPPSVIKQLTGHSKDVTDFDFTSNNQYIASSSLDKTVRIWEISKGLCIRVIYGVSSQLCIRFHLVFNFSAGRIVSKITLDNEISAMDHDHPGQLIFCWDAQGCVNTACMNSYTGSLSRSHRNKSSNKHKSPVTTVQYRTFSLLAHGPVLLTFTRDGSLSFFSVSLETQGYLTLRYSLKLGPRLHSIRASFCPLLSLEKGEYIVVGSEDFNVYFYDLTRPKHTCVNKLQVHLTSKSTVQF